MEVLPETITRMIQLRSLTPKMTIKQVTDTLNNEGHRSIKGNLLNKHTVRRICDSNGSEKLVTALVRTASYVRKGTVNPQLWVKDNMREEDGGRVSIKEVGAAYRKYCEGVGKSATNNVSLGIAMKEYSRIKTNGERFITGWVLK